MGLCFSKKKGAPCDTPGSDPPPPSDGKNSSEKERVKKRDTKKQPAVVPNKAAGEQPVSEKKPVFVVTQNAKLVEEKRKVGEVPTEKSEIRKEVEAVSAGKEAPAGEIRAVPVPVMVRTSSCTKEEVDAILIQCGRLSRSSSGKTSNETAGGGAYRRYSGSKRSFDFDHERKGEEYDDERAVSRPSPHRRTPGRERSGSRERGSSNGSHSRRVSRSPGRRTDGTGPASAGSAIEKTKPAKMVSVPAREKPSSDQAGSAIKKGSNTNSSAVSVKRNASPRSRSPASNSLNRSVGGAGNENVGIGAQPTLSRSSSRKAEHSPYRRNPMAEIDENLLRGNQNGSASFRSQKGNQTQSQRTESMISSHKGSVDESKTSRSHAVVTNCIRDQFVTCRVKDQENSAEEPFDPLGSFKSNEINFTNITLDSLNTKPVVSTNRSSRRSSRDFDHHGNSSYTNIILEDIQNYHQNNNANSASQNPISFTIPECVSKACSILEAVADLNSSSSEGRHGYKPKEPFLESEVAVKNDLMEPSMHKYVSVRDLGAEVEPQESAGSNSVVGQPWASTWEPNSADSTDRYMAGSRSNNNMEEVEQEVPVGEARQARHDRRLLRGGSNASGVSGGPNSKKRETVDRQINRNGTGGVRTGTRAASITASASASAC